MSANEDELDDMDADDAPEMKSHDGMWDNVVNTLILAAPWVAISGILGYMILTTGVNIDITFTGEIPIQPFAYLIGAGIALTYLLALMKFYGAAPLAYIFHKGHNFMKNYNPRDD